MKAFTKVGTGLLFLSLIFSLPVFADSTFVRFGSSWKYLDNGSDAGSGWKDQGFNDSSWPTGQSAFGYGTSYERTKISFGNNPDNKFITTYFRKTITVSNVSDFLFFKLNLYVDDGAVMYVNGNEVMRVNIAAPVPQYFTPASVSVAENGNIVNSQIIRSTSFKNGVNDIAVEVHQYNRQTRSMLFDLELAGISGSNSPEVVRGPLLQMVNTTGITVKWKTNLPSTSTVRYGTSENALTAAVSDNALVSDHELRITGLQPDTKYYYSIGTNAFTMKGSYRNSFLTAPPANTTRKIRIGVIGDAGTGDINQQKSRDRYLETYRNGGDPDLAIMLGDNAYPLGTDKDYQGGFFNIYNDNLFNNHSVFSVPGNHEYAGVASISDIAYYSIFSLPAAGECGGLPSGTESYYSFDYGNIHFIMLNSYGYDGGKVLYDTTGQQALWLKADLAANAGKHKWTIACLHHPPYSNSNHYSDGEADLTAIREKITPILERFGVDMVLAGHSHGYERSYLIRNHTGKSTSFIAANAPAGNLISGSSAAYDGSENSCPYIVMDTTAAHGTMYVVAGGAGQLGGGNNAKFPLFYFRNYAATPGAECGILTLEVQDNRIDGKFIGANSGNVLDRFTLMKGAGLKRTVVSEANTPVTLTASYLGNYNWTAASSAITSGSRTFTFTPATSNTFTYYVSDNENQDRRCITDTFVIRTYAAILPSNIEFTATEKPNSVSLKWTTQQEMNTDYFLLERSANGQDYATLATVPSKGPSSILLNYEFEDKLPLAGDNYYRLILISQAGKRTDLGVRTVNFIVSYSMKVAVKTNPAPSQKVELLIQNSRPQPLTINITDMQGASVYAKELTVAAGTQSMILHLRPGSYVLTGTTMDGLICSERLMVY